MRTYWDERGRLNAPFYVDTTMSYDEPDMDHFFDAGYKTVSFALDTAPVRPPSTALAVDIGCGLGRMCVPLADRFDRVVGVDISQEMASRARRLVRRDNISFIVGDGSSLAAIRDSTADVVFSFAVLQHIPRVQMIDSYLKEAGRILRPGGLLVFQWSNLPGALRWRIRRSVFAILQHTRAGDRLGRDDPAFLGSRVPLDRITRALGAGGLRLVQTHGLGGQFAYAWAVKG
jgi:SAM-dependent methyltransferase